MLGEVYEYFLEQFALAEGRQGGEFYTPRHVVRLLVAMLEPYGGRVYDPCCGSSGMFVQSVEFIEAHASGNGNGGMARRDISIYGQESNHTTWRLARMNLAIRGIEGQIKHGDSFHNDRHPDLRADYILANPPFNVSRWGGDRLRDDRRWVYGVPPTGNANFAWVQHFLHHLAPRGIAGFVLANGSMSSQQSGEGEIRKNIVEDDLVDCIIALPGQLFRSTQIPACLWFLRRGRTGQEHERPDQSLFIDARKFGHMVDRTRRELSQEDIARIADTYHAWRSKDGHGEYADVPGFCKSATRDEIRQHGHVLTPGRYVGTEPQPDDGEPFDQKMTRLAAQWREQVAEAQRLDAAIEANLEMLGFGPSAARPPRGTVDYGLFISSLRRLEEHDNLTRENSDPSDIERRILVDASAHLFTTCFDRLWKVLKRYLIAELELDKVPNSPEPVLTLAHDNGLLPSPLEQWLRYAKARVYLVEDYFGDQTETHLALIPDFITDAINLFEALTGDTWQPEAPQ